VVFTPTERVRMICLRGWNRDGTEDGNKALRARRYDGAALAIQIRRSAKFDNGGFRCKSSAKCFQLSRGISP
jgi:hypothetical protein